MIELSEVIVLTAVMALLYSKQLSLSARWTAAITPLASIIGSGFLVCGPLLAAVFFQDALAAMVIVVVLGYGLGEAVRFNIQSVEPLLEENRAQSTHSNTKPISLLSYLEVIADLGLSIAYVISVAFYIRLLAAFCLRLFTIKDPVWANLFATIVLLTIAYVGWYKNLKGLLLLERHAVQAKLAIILCLLTTLAIHFYNTPAPAVSHIYLPREKIWSFENIAYLAGILLIIQGFETSRYLGKHFTAEVRMQSMRLAQLLSGLIYCCFIYWAADLFIYYDGDISETGIISVVGGMSLILPYLLIAAAIFSQFSAAIADTVGAGGLQAQLSNGGVSERFAYLCISGLAIALIWATDIFRIITIASKAFAFYYLIQCLEALVASYILRKRVTYYIIPTIMLAFMLFVILFGKPVEA